MSQRVRHRVRIYENASNSGMLRRFRHCPVIMTSNSAEALTFANTVFCFSVSLFRKNDKCNGIVRPGDVIGRILTWGSNIKAAVNGRRHVFLANSSLKRKRLQWYAPRGNAVCCILDSRILPGGSGESCPRNLIFSCTLWIVAFGNLGWRRHQPCPIFAGRAHF